MDFHRQLTGVIFRRQAQPLWPVSTVLEQGRSILGKHQSRTISTRAALRQGMSGPIRPCNRRQAPSHSTNYDMAFDQSQVALAHRFGNEKPVHRRAAAVLFRGGVRRIFLVHGGRTKTGHLRSRLVGRSMFGRVGGGSCRRKRNRSMLAVSTESIRLHADPVVSTRCFPPTPVVRRGVGFARSRPKPSDRPGIPD